MKMLLLASLILGTTFAQAATTITVMEATIVGARTVDQVDTRFQLDTTTGEGYVKATVTQEVYQPWDNGPWGGGWTNCTPYGGCIPRPMPRPVPTYRTIFQDEVRVEGLALHGDRVVYAGANGDVDCGRFGYSNVLRIPTIYLNGNCSTDGKIDRNGKLTVTFSTK